MRCRVWLASVALFVVIGAGLRPLQATVVLPATLDELATAAVAIFHGRVVDVQARWEPGRRQIESFVSIEAADYLKGDLGPTVIVRVSGGEIGSYRTIVVGAPTFAPGDEVILFVGATGPSYPYVLGLNQGVFRVVRARARLPVVVPPLVGMSDTPTIVRGDPRRRPIMLEQFVSAVRTLVAQAPQGATTLGAGR